MTPQPPPDLVDLYRTFGVAEIVRRSDTDRETVYGWLRAANVELDNGRRGNLAQRRPQPSDFRERYIELGVEGCCDHYRADRDTVRRWRREEGEAELKTARAARLRCSHDATVRRPPANASPRPENETSRAAAHWLRFPKHGGWLVSRRERDGMYFVGSMPMTAEQLVAFATKRGWKGGGA